MDEKNEIIENTDNIEEKEEKEDNRLWGEFFLVECPLGIIF